jgi:HD-GYP domain-containing protein (c-di-GMP phosphodiesterase class II)
VAHQTALRMMAEAAGSQFNPALFAVFRRCADQFEKIFLETPT